MATIKEFLSFNDFINSEYSEKLADNFGMSHRKKSVDAGYSKYNAQIFIIEADYYGLDFKVFIRYNADGINFLKEYTYGGSCLNSYGFRYAHSGAFGEVSTKEYRESLSRLEKAIPVEKNPDTKEVLKQVVKGYKEITFSNQWMENCKENRNIWRKQSFSTLTQLG